MSKHYANLFDDSDTCPFCDSFKFTQIDVDKYFCRDCGETWKELEENIDLNGDD